MKYLSRNIYYLFRKQNDIIYLKNSRKYSKIINENDNIENTSHIPVMVNEVLHYLEPSPGKIFVDMTFGAGGHSMKILESSPNIKIFALDRDPIAHQFALKLSEKYPEQIIPLLGRFSELPQLLCKYKVNVNSIDGFLFDFGCSSMQLDIGERGFSLSKDGPLDMRMDGFRYPQEPTAAEVLKEITEEDLAFILKIYDYGKHYTLTEMKALNRIPWKMLHKHVITPTEEEINKNPRSRSAKFRAITKVI